MSEPDDEFAVFRGFLNAIAITVALAGAVAFGIYVGYLFRP